MAEGVRISLRDARRMMEEETTTVLDVVDSPSYEETPDRIQGAVRIAPEELKERFQELPMGRPVLAY
jgi:rhodanese-related sulfurtransferase